MKSETEIEMIVLYKKSKELGTYFFVYLILVIEVHINCLKGSIGMFIVDCS